MKLRDIAKEVREILQGNCGWVVLYRDGRRWEYLETYCYGNATNDYAWEFDCETERQQLLNILEVDPNAIILNGFAVGLDDDVNMNIETLTDELKSAYLFDDHLKLANHKESITNARVIDYYAQPVEDIPEVKSSMLILVACEESQAVTTELRKLGHTAFSCDIQACSGGHPEWHIQGDVLNYLNGGCDFTTMDGNIHAIVGSWDMIIAFPPCTHLAVSGARHFAKKRADGRQQQGIDFFMAMVNADCNKIAIENPVGIMSTVYRKPDQIVQPYEFGDPHRKKTCLWLKGLPKLHPTNVVEPCDIRTYVKRDGTTTTFSDWYNHCGKERKKLRSKTFKGIAQAMATQWTGGVLNG